MGLPVLSSVSLASLLPTFWDRRTSSFSFGSVWKSKSGNFCTILARYVCEQPASLTMDEQSTREHISVYTSTHTYVANIKYIPVYYCCLNNKGLDLRWEFTLWTTQFHTGYETDMESCSVLSVSYVLKPNLQSYESQFIVLAEIYSSSYVTISPNYYCMTSLPIPPIQLSITFIHTCQLKVIFSSLFVSVTSSALS